MKALKHPATIIALLALFIGLGGGAALASGLISGKNIKNHTIAKKKLTRKAIKALRGQRGPTGAIGPTGATGPTGLTGPQGPIGPSSGMSFYNTSTVVYGTAGANVATLLLPGPPTLGPSFSWVVFGNTTISDTANAQATTCSLQMFGPAGTFDRATASTAVPAPEVETLHLVGPLNTVGPASVSIFCQSNDTNAKAVDSHLVAIQLGAVSGS
jgi:hypothetical protein